MLVYSICFNFIFSLATHVYLPVSFSLTAVENRTSRKTAQRPSTPQFATWEIGVGSLKARLQTVSLSAVVHEPALTCLH